MKTFFVLSCLWFCSSAQTVQTKFEFWPGASYDPAIPTEKTVFGREPGDRVSSPDEVVRYMEALAAAAPSRMKLFDYAKTWEGRRLIYAVIGSEANIARLPEIQANMKRLADPRKTPDTDAQKLMNGLPVVIWLAYGVHGNEISSSDAALQVAYHLLASRNDQLVKSVLSNVVVILDPMQNPDGRNRFVQNFNIAEGLEPDSNPLSAEHSEPWPGGRTNHYYFDMNRDWFAMTQPETIGRIKIVQEWLPLVFVDLHEMGSDSTYYFAPEANPYNPHIVKPQRESLEWFGLNNAHWFDQFGFSYFTKEGYDEFYPGYGASWPLYYGSIAMTYEQGSTRGLVVKRSDGVLVNYRDTVRQHFVSSLSTAETSARNREKLLANFYRYRQTAIEEGSREPIREYILPRQGNTSQVDKLAANLADQGIEVKRATGPFQNAGKTYPAGSYVISTAQPSKRLIRTLLDEQTSMDPEFLKGEERRRQARQSSEMYDVTAFSIPLQYGVLAVTTPEVSKASFEAVPQGFRLEGKVVGGNATVAYLVPWGISASARFLTAGLRQGLRIATTDRPFKQDGRTYPSGTLIIKVKENAPTLADAVQKLAKDSGAEVYSTNSGWVDEGPNFGSHRVVYFPPIKIAMAWDRPTGASSAGATRFLLERQFGYPVTVVRTQQLGSGDLSQFQVIILPDGGFGEGYAAVLGPNGARKLKDWVEAGGTLIGLGPGALSYLSDARTSLLSISQENVVRDSGEKKSTPVTAPATPPGVAAATTQGAPPATPSGRVAGKLITSEQDFEKAILPDTELPDSLHGVLLRTKVNQDHWVTAGVPETVYVMVTGRAVYSPIKLDKGMNAAFFEGPDKLMASGYMWEQNRKQLAYKPFLVVEPAGRGSVVGFTADPNFRGYMDGLNMLFLNAVFRGPAHARSGGAFGE